MIKSRNKDFIEKIKNRAERSLKIEEVYLNSKFYSETINYLQKQKYLKFPSINKLLKNSFISDYPLGYVMKNENNNVVGFMGTIYSRRNFNNQEYIYCNIHSWIVDETYRINSFLLLMPLINQKITLTAFTPVKSLVGLLEKFNFKKVKMKYRVICFFNFFILKNNDYIIEKDSDIIKKKINQADLKIYENYNKLPYEKFIITNKIDSSKYIFVIASRAKKNGLNVLNLFYISNNEEFKKNWDKFKFIILKEFKVNFCSQYFFNDFCNALPDNIFLSKTEEKYVCIKNALTDINLDILYSDLIG